MPGSLALSGGQQLCSRRGMESTGIREHTLLAGACLQEYEDDPAKRLQDAELDHKSEHEDVNQQQKDQAVVQLVIVVVLETSVLPPPSLLKPLTLRQSNRCVTWSSIYVKCTDDVKQDC